MIHWPVDRESMPFQASPGDTCRGSWRRGKRITGKEEEEICRQHAQRCGKTEHTTIVGARSLQPEVVAAGNNQTARF